MRIENKPKLQRIAIHEWSDFIADSGWLKISKEASYVIAWRSRNANVSTPTGKKHRTSPDAISSI